MTELRDGPFVACCNIASSAKLETADEKLKDRIAEPDLIFLKQHSDSTGFEQTLDVRDAVLKSLQADSSERKAVRLASSWARKSQSSDYLGLNLYGCVPSIYVPRRNIWRYDEVSLNLMDVIDPDCVMEGRVFDLLPIRESFFKWLSRWNLNAGWCSSCALQTMRFWRVDNYALNRLEWYLPCALKLAEVLSYQVCANEGRDLNVPRPPKGFPIWRPTLIPRKTYLSSIEKDVRSELEKSSLLNHLPPKLRLDCVEVIRKKASEYCKEVEKGFGAYLKGVKQEPKLLDHIIWAARFQVAGDRYAKIAAESKVEPITAHKYVEKVLGLIGLAKRRDTRRGRPPGSRTVNSSGHNVRRRKKTK